MSAVNSPNSSQNTISLSEMRLFYDADIDTQALLSKHIAVVGFGSQGFGQSMNLKDSGAQVKIGCRTNSSSSIKAKQAGFEVLSVEEAVQWADVLVVLIPDVDHHAVYETQMKPYLKPGQTLVFSHGFSVQYGQVVPPDYVNVVLVAPKSPGHLVRSEFQRNRGVPALMAVYQDATGEATQLALAYAACLGSGRAGILETTFQDETETDLFGEQAVLCGGVTSLIKAGFETLVEAGYPAELAYFECLHELKLIVDLLYEGGLEDMRYSISDTARYGDVTRGPEVIGPQVKSAMQSVLRDIQTGAFAKEWISECQTGRKRLNQLVQADHDHPLETTGRSLRQMMSWLYEERMVDRQKN